MTEDRQKWAEMLKKIGSEEALVWISANVATADTPDFENKTGWLRFMNSDGLENLVAGTLPIPDARIFMSGEWVEDNSTVTARLRGDTVELRTVAEVSAETDKAMPALRHEVRTLTRAVPGDAGGYMRIAVYMGFRTEDDFKAGKLSTIAERFIGFSNEVLPAQREGAE